jgi:hypothetical protein
VCSNGDGCVDSEKYVTPPWMEYPVRHVEHRREASPVMFGVASTVDTTARTMPMTAMRTNSAGSRRRARPAQKRRNRMVPLPLHCRTRSDVIRNPERTKKKSTP